MMRKFGISITMLLAFLLPCSLGALDLSVTGGAGNNSFDPAEKDPLGVTRKQFEGVLYPLGTVSVTGDYSKTISFRAAFDRDPILRNRFFTDIGVDFNYLHLDFGPFIGPFNTDGRAVNPGITAGLELAVPGILFGRIKTSSTIGTVLSLPGDYLQQENSAALGFWIPNVVISLALDIKSYTERVDKDLITKDERTRYHIIADVFSKNVPYTVTVDAGYQSLTRSYTPKGGANDTETDELKSIYLGFDVQYRINPRFGLILGAEMPVYSWSTKPLIGPDVKTLLYEAHGGFVWTIAD
jgi:hypothetical protein